MYIKPKNIEYEKIFDKLVKERTAVIDTNIAQALSRHKKIRYARENGHIFIANDRNMHKSIVHIPFNIKIRKDKNKFFFEF